MTPLSGWNKWDLRHPLMRECCLALEFDSTGPGTLGTAFNQVGLRESPTVNGSALTIAPTIGARIGRAIQGTGTNGNYLTYPTTVNRWGTNNAMSFIVVHRPFVTTGENRQAGYNSNTGNYVLLRTTGGKYQALSNCITGTTLTGSTSFAANTTYVIGVSLSAATGATLYLNGSQEATGSFTGTLSIATSFAICDDRASSLYPLNGLIESVLVFSRGLSGEEHRKHYNAWRSGRGQLKLNPTLVQRINSSPSNRRRRFFIGASQ